MGSLDYAAQLVLFNQCIGDESGRVIGRYEGPGTFRSLAWASGPAYRRTFAGGSGRHHSPGKLVPGQCTSELSEYVHNDEVTDSYVGTWLQRKAGYSSKVAKEDSDDDA